MIYSINEADFILIMEKYHKDDFSPDGLSALFHFLENKDADYDIDPHDINKQFKEYKSCSDAVLDHFDGIELAEDEESAEKLLTEQCLGLIKAKDSIIIRF